MNVVKFEVQAECPVRGLSYVKVLVYDVTSSFKRAVPVLLDHQREFEEGKVSSLHET